MLSLPTNVGLAPFVVSISMIAPLITVHLDNTLIRMGEQGYAEDEERGPNPILRPLQYESIPCG